MLVLANVECQFVRLWLARHGQVPEKRLQAVYSLQMANAKAMAQPTQPVLAECLDSGGGFPSPSPRPGRMRALARTLYTLQAGFRGKTWSLPFV